MTRACGIPHATKARHSQKLALLDRRLQTKKQRFFTLSANKVFLSQPLVKRVRYSRSQVQMSSPPDTLIRSPQVTPRRL